MKVYQFTHEDLDGAGCAVVARVFFGDCLETFFVNYADIDAKLDSWLAGMRTALSEDSGLLLLISDITPGDERCFVLDDLYKNKVIDVLCVDHHKTKSHLQQFKWVHFDERVCGTRLLYRISPNMPHTQSYPIVYAGLENFVGAINAYDLWLLKDPLRKRGEELNRLVHFLGFERFVREFSKDMNADQSGWLSALAPILREREDAEVKSILDAQSPCAIQTDQAGRKYGVFVAHGNVSRIASAALERNPEIDYVAVINPTIQKIGLRSRIGSGVDVADIARRSGGGGHSTASAFFCPLHKFLGEVIAKTL